MNGFFKTYIDLFQTIEESIEKGRIVPALILIYSAIDSFSSFANTTNKKGREVFKEWVKKWMLANHSLPCNEADIYAARCALLHQQVSQSDLSINGKAKEIFYAWGNRDHKALQFSIKAIGTEDTLVAVKIEDLMWSLRRGMADCMAEIDKDVEWKKAFDDKASKMFASINHEQLYK